MCYLFNNTKTVKINQAFYRLLTVFCISVLATGCANNVANNTASNKVAVAKNPQIRTQQQVVVINQPRKTAGTINNTKARARQSVKPIKHRRVKDQHHIEYDKKRMWYNQQWLVKQEAEEQQRIQRLQYQRKYEEKLREQAQLKKQQQAQLRREQEQQRQQSAAANTGMVQRAAAVINPYQQRQAQIEARQQQYNWRQDGGWDQAQIQARAQAQHRAQQQQIRQQYQQRWQYQQRLQQQHQQRQQRQRVARAWHNTGNLAERLSNAAIARTYHKVRYDGSYIPLSYPMGDVPANIGVCTDTLIRSYRRLGIDLQQLVHEDISRAFHVYPNLPKWGLSAPDPNIDHRRVHNLKVFFARHGQRLPVTNNPADYRPGDIVTWHLGGDQEHIGLVVNRRSPEDPRRYMIVHNIAKGDRMEDILFKMPITGHYRYLPHNRSRWMASR